MHQNRLKGLISARASEKKWHIGNQWPVTYFHCGKLTSPI